MPIDYSRYPPDWKTVIVPRIRARARARCERCGARAWQFGWRDSLGRFRPGTPPVLGTAGQLFQLDPEPLQPPMIRIILTVAHLDHDEQNWQVSDDRLALLCQACHLNHDRPDNARRTKYGKEHAAQPQLPL